MNDSLPRGGKYEKADDFDERHERDANLTTIIKEGYTPAQPTEENPKPRVIDGSLTPEANSALYDLYVAYKPLVANTAKKLAEQYKNYPAITFDDLMSEGYFGVWHGALNWDPSYGTGFLGYVSKNIKEYQKRFCSNHSTAVRLPLDARESVADYRRAVWQTYSAECRYPDHERIARVLGLTASRVDRIAISEAMTSQMGSLDRGYYADDRETHSTYERGAGDWRAINPSSSEMISVEDHAMGDALSRSVNEAVDKNSNLLTIRESTVIDLRYFGNNGAGMTLQEVGDELGVSRERIRVIEANAFSKLRGSYTSRDLKDLLF